MNRSAAITIIDSPYRFTVSGVKIETIRGVHRIELDGEVFWLDADGEGIQIKGLVGELTKYHLAGGLL